MSEESDEVCEGMRVAGDAEAPRLIGCQTERAVVDGRCPDCGRKADVRLGLVKRIVDKGAPGPRPYGRGEGGG